MQENPYTLAKEIHGIGFATADQIAQSVGIPKDSQNRARAGIDHVLLGATSEGHCALPLEKLKAAAVKLLEVPAETIEQALSQMLTSGFLLLEEIDNEPLVFLPHLRKAEDGIAAKIRRLVKGSVTYLHKKEPATVLLIDLDPQFNATQCVMDYKTFEDHRKQKGTIADLLIDQPGLALKTKKIRKNPAGALYRVKETAGIHSGFDYSSFSCGKYRLFPNPYLLGRRDRGDAPIDSVEVKGRDFQGL